MDPLTHGLLGAVAAQSYAKRSHMKWAAVLGGLAALAPDLDVFIRSVHDPLLMLEYHRHFTHSIFFAPVGALLVAMCLWPFMRKMVPFKRMYVYCLVGFATHGLLDACTSYGTHLTWPLSQARIAWGVVSIIDPVVPIILAIFLVITLGAEDKTPARTGIAVVILYLLMGMTQHERVEQQLIKTARMRDHHLERVYITPTFANLILWRGMYESGGKVYIDGYYALPFMQVKLVPGTNATVIDAGTAFPALSSNSVQRKDLERFSFFADGFIAVDTQDASRVVDLRYSDLPNNNRPFWGIQMDVNNPNRHVEFTRQPRPDKDSWVKLSRMLRGQF